MSDEDVEYEYREVKSLTSIMWLIDETEEGDDVGTQGNVKRAEGGGGGKQDRGLEGGARLYILLTVCFPIVPALVFSF